MALLELSASRGGWDGCGKVGRGVQPTLCLWGKICVFSIFITLSCM